jgi:hypothetical protein
MSFFVLIKVSGMTVATHTNGRIAGQRRQVPDPMAQTNAPLNNQNDPPQPNPLLGGQKDPP